MGSAAFLTHTTGDHMTGNETSWQPIETAPREGVLVWLYWPEPLAPEGQYGYEDVEWGSVDGLTQCVGKWIAAHRGGNWVVPLISVYFGVPSDPSCDLDFIEVDPTHWMPLPAPPDGIGP